MRHYALGFDQDQILITELSRDLCIKHKDAFTGQLMKYPDIEGVAFSAQKVGGEDAYSTYEFTHKEEAFPGFFLSVSPSFLDVMGIEVTDGNRFSPSDDKDGNFHFIFNETARRANGLEVGEMVDMGWGPGRITGFIGDVALTSLREEEQNIAFCVSPDNKFQWLSYAYIRLRAGADVTKAVDRLREVVAGLDASYPLEVEFYDSLYNRLYHREEFVKKMVTGASLLAILISVVGVFGLVIFETEYRRREIGIRKVYGATVTDILLMFNRKYLTIVVVCFILATPVAYLSAAGWLENFA
ncbi:ABC transporter permease, partial [uncultured Parabacteroides sp.]